MRMKMTTQTKESENENENEIWILKFEIWSKPDSDIIFRKFRG